MTEFDFNQYVMSPSQIRAIMDRRNRQMKFHAFGFHAFGRRFWFGTELIKPKESS